MLLSHIASEKMNRIVISIDFKTDLIDFVIKQQRASMHVGWEAAVSSAGDEVNLIREFLDFTLCVLRCYEWLV